VLIVCLVFALARATARVALYVVCQILGVHSGSVWQVVSVSSPVSYSSSNWISVSEDEQSARPSHLGKIVQLAARCSRPLVGLFFCCRWWWLVGML
jgi:hypothetical protein